MKKTALILAISIILAGLCGCAGKTTENYFGGSGRLVNENGIMEDDDNIYFGYAYNWRKYNKKTDAFSVVCNDPGCTHGHDVETCKANQDYCLFNGELIKVYNEVTILNDNTIFNQGFLYLCGDSEKQVYKNELPEGIDKEIYDNGIGVLNTLGDDYLVLFQGLYVYILDADFNVKYTILGPGSYSGGVYYANNEIYYIDNLYRLQKLDMESGEPSLVDLGGMKITEGAVADNTLWFSNGDKTLCSYDFKTGEVKEHSENAAVRITPVGKYIVYMAYNEGDFYLYDIETGESHRREETKLSGADLFFWDGNYYNYNSLEDELVQYNEDYSSVIKSWSLSD